MRGKLHRHKGEKDSFINDMKMAAKLAHRMAQEALTNAGVI
jgi:hypothetical protein